MINQLDILLNAILLAGNSVRAIQQKKFVTTLKENHDPLTEADVAANQILKNSLLGAFPHDDWLSEESIDDFKRLSAKRVWIVDPIDGTREFIQGIPEYAISVALFDSGELCLSAVFNPMTDELFYAQKNKGAWLNNERIYCTDHYPIILVSRTEVASGKWNTVDHQTIRSVGSIAYKLALVAAGKAYGTLSIEPKNEWDIAAGVFLIQEALGFATDLNNQPFVFNQACVRVNGVIAGHHNFSSVGREIVKSIKSAD